jgi:tetratricopeptide (TPR) repeat protein
MYKQYYEYDWEGAAQGYKRALELNPSLTDAWYHQAWHLELFGRDDEAIAAGEKTVELSPLGPFYLSWLADQYRDAGDYDKAIEMAESVLELNPDYPVAWLVIGNAYGEMGRFDEAIAAHKQIADYPFWSWALATTYGWAGQADKAREILTTIEPEVENAIPLALIYASLGDVDNALHWMNQAREIKIPWYPWLLGWFAASRVLHDEPVIIAQAQELGVPLQSGPD